MKYQPFRVREEGDGRYFNVCQSIGEFLAPTVAARTRQAALMRVDVISSKDDEGAPRGVCLSISAAFSTALLDVLVIYADTVSDIVLAGSLKAVHDQWRVAYFIFIFLPIVVVLWAFLEWCEIFSCRGPEGFFLHGSANAYSTHMANSPTPFCPHVSPPCKIFSPV